MGFFTLGAQYTQQVPPVEDPEDVVGSETAIDHEAPPARWGARNLVGVAVGLVCLVACGALAATKGSGLVAGSPPPQGISARALLEGPEMVDVATRNIMRTNQKVFGPKHEHYVRDTVARGLKNITERIRVGNPEAFERLDALTLSKEQREGILRVVRHMGDPRVQSIGFEVAKSVKDGVHEGPQGVKRRLKERFQHRALELRQLRDEIVPEILRKFNGKERYASGDPDSMRIIREFPESWKAELDLSQPSSRRLSDEGWEHWNGGEDAEDSEEGDEKDDEDDVSESGQSGAMLSDTDMTSMAAKFEEGLGIVAGLIEQARVAIDNIDFCGESFGVNLKIPYWAKSFVGGLSFVTELSDCVARAGSNEVKMVMCPMKYASAFSDFVSMVDNVFGVNNGHFWETFNGGTAPNTQTAGAQVGGPTFGAASPHQQPSAYAQPQQQQTAWNWS